MGETISVAIPVYNRAGWIAQTLEHIFAQSVPVNEVVLCDDGSTDDLESALEPFRNRVKLVRIENSGPAIARKNAIENCSGEWIALCDSDDFWCPGHIKTFCDAKTLFPDMDMYFSDFHTTDDMSKSKFEKAPSGWLKLISEHGANTDADYIRCGNDLLAGLLQFQACFQSSSMFRRSLYEKVGGIKPYVSRWRSEDFHLTLRMAAVCRAVISQQATVTINKHPDNFSADYVATLDGRLAILKDIVDNRLVPDSFHGVLRTECTESELSLFRAFYWAGKYNNALGVWPDLAPPSVTYRDYLRFIISYFKAAIS